MCMPNARKQQQQEINHRAMGVIGPSWTTFTLNCSCADNRRVARRCVGRAGVDLDLSVRCESLSLMRGTRAAGVNVALSIDDVAAQPECTATYDGVRNFQVRRCVCGCASKRVTE